MKSCSKLTLIYQIKVVKLVILDKYKFVESEKAIITIQLIHTHVTEQQLIFHPIFDLEKETVISPCSKLNIKTKKMGKKNKNSKIEINISSFAECHTGSYKLRYWNGNSISTTSFELGKKEHIRRSDTCNTMKCPKGYRREGTECDFELCHGQGIRK